MPTPKKTYTVVASTDGKNLGMSFSRKPIVGERIEFLNKFSIEVVDVVTRQDGQITVFNPNYVLTLKES